tara:strand:+ start:432 stop:2354 length:1923 start_codon:yes stop_codon:yes gene_type:complete
MDMGILEKIEIVLSSGDQLTSKSIGTDEELSAEKEAIALSPFLDEIAKLLVSLPKGEVSVLVEILLCGLKENQSPIVYRDTLDVIAKNYEHAQLYSDDLLKILKFRIENRGSETNSLLSVYSLEMVLKLVLIGAVNKHHLLALLEDIGSNECNLFAEHAAKIVGVAYHYWRDPNLISVLDRIGNIESAKSEADFEKGLAVLSLALTSQDETNVRQQLSASKTLFKSSAAHGENRSDALLYEKCIEVVEAFFSEEPQSVFCRLSKELDAASIDRTHLMQKALVPSWLDTRASQQFEWQKLTNKVLYLSDKLGRDSWLDAMAVMQEVLSVYTAHTSLNFASGLKFLLQPTIEVSFIRHSGLCAHLNDLINDKKWNEKFGQLAQPLQKSLVVLKESGSWPGKPTEDSTKSSILSTILGEQYNEDHLSVQDSEKIETLLKNYIDEREQGGNPVIARVQVKIHQQLSVCIDYEGAIARNFNTLLSSILKFCESRIDNGRKSLGERGKYLFTMEAKENDLQSDLHDWLSGNLISGNIKTEVSDVSSGRTDIYVTFGSYSFVIELKKHEGVVDQSSSEVYIGQAGQYQATNVKLGLLGILELVSGKTETPNLEDCFWFNSYVPKGTVTQRNLVVFRVPGNKTVPSQL